MGGSQLQLPPMLGRSACRRQPKTKPCSKQACRPRWQAASAGTAGGDARPQPHLSPPQRHQQQAVHHVAKEVGLRLQWSGSCSTVRLKLEQVGRAGGREAAKCSFPRSNGPSGVVGSIPYKTPPAAVAANNIARGSSGGGSAPSWSRRTPPCRCAAAAPSVAGEVGGGRGAAQLSWAAGEPRSRRGPRTSRPTRRPAASSGAHSTERAARGLKVCIQVHAAVGGREQRMAGRGRPQRAGRHRSGRGHLPKRAPLHASLACSSSRAYWMRVSLVAPMVEPRLPM